jgi:uncharacterized membrane protein
MVQNRSPMTNLIPTLRQTARTLAITLLLGASLFTLPAAAAEADAQPAPGSSAQPADAQQPAPGNYAAREQEEAKLDAFKGGDTVVVVGGTTLVIVLLVVLIIVIL